ncbi:hypothetical protein [Mycobacterium tilburgii]|uniref:hypothetical protein n=1 Tax=Mycobacterium tilburgii TaxID=44467 RepID=UPI0021B3D501|nr:hypothetical protein [Mycobacterium tilburgii]
MTEVAVQLAADGEVKVDAIDNRHRHHPVHRRAALGRVQRRLEAIGRPGDTGA